MYIKNGDIDVPIIKGATYIYDPQVSRAKQNRGRLFELVKFHENEKSEVYWLDTKRYGKIKLSGALLYDYLPSEEDIIEIGLVKIPVLCWKCKKNTFVIAGTVLKVKEHRRFFNFPFLVDFLLEKKEYIDYAKENEIGSVEKRYSKTIHEKYISNGCFYCDVLQGDYFIREELLEYRIHDEIPEPTFIASIKHSKLMKIAEEAIVFKTI